MKNNVMPKYNVGDSVRLLEIKKGNDKIPKDITYINALYTVATVVGYEDTRKRRVKVQLSDGSIILWRSLSTELYSVKKDDEESPISSSEASELFCKQNSTLVGGLAQSNQQPKREVEFPVSDAFEIPLDVAKKIVLDPDNFIKQVKKQVEDNIEYPTMDHDKFMESNKLFQLGMIIDLVKSYNDVSVNPDFCHHIKFSSNYSGHPIFIIQPTSFDKEILAFKSRNLASEFLSKNKQYLTKVSDYFKN